MNPRTTRIIKEARALFWPWCAVMTAGVLPLVQQQSHSSLHGIPHSIVEPICILGFFGGIPLLATLSLGNEFQHRTLSLLLTQPVSRTEIWGEKLSVTIVAVLSAALIFSLAWWVGSFQLDTQDLAFVGAWIIATLASATFWTLFARSTLGGVTLNISANYFIAVVWMNLEWIRGKGFLSPANITVVSTVTFVFLCYAGVMLWLGGRKLAQFQATGGMAGDDLLMAGPSVMPGALAGWFRCRPTGAFVNLIRKELRLLRPVWLITLLAVVGWTCLTILRLVPEHGFGRLIPPHGGFPRLALLFAVGLVAALSIAIAILAGSVSLGEERTSGTHSWHMTLPVSARRQWLIKLVMAMLTGLVCAGLLPVLVLIAGGSLFGSPLMFVDPHGGMVWLVTMPLLTFASFWCASVVSGTVRAVLWLFPMIGALLLVGQCGDWVARELAPTAATVLWHLGSKFDPDFRFTNAVSSIQLDARDATQFGTLWWAPTLLFAVIQSYRLFRTELRDSTLPVIRRLLPLATLAFLCVISLGAFYAFVDHAKEQMGTLFRETHEAIEKIQPGTAMLDATHPLQLTVEDLAKASPLSERTRRWLRNSRISVAPDEAHLGRYCCGGNVKGIIFAPDKAYSWYLATIHLASGSDCTLSFKSGSGFGILGGVCK